MLLFFSHSFTSNWVMHLWEEEVVEMASLDTYNVAIVFSGVTKTSMPYNDRVYFRQGADRITHALHLYQMGKVEHIVVSGGLEFQQADALPAAERLKSFLTMAGVPEKDITVEPEARNTYENGVFSAEILKTQFPGQKYLLITSAFHMKRAALCLKGQDVSFDIFPAGFRSDPVRMTFDNMVIPSAASLGRWEALLKEWFGLATYYVMGYF